MARIRETWQHLNRNAAEWVAALLGLLAVVAIAGASSRAEGLVLRAYFLACVDDDAAAADAELAAVAERLDWKGILRFRAFAMTSIVAADGYPEEAQRRLNDLAASILRAPMPEPFWERLLARARRRRSVRVPGGRESRGRFKGIGAVPLLRHSGSAERDPEPRGPTRCWLPLGSGFSLREPRNDDVICAPRH